MSLIQICQKSLHSSALQKVARKATGITGLSSGIIGDTLHITQRSNIHAVSVPDSALKGCMCEDSVICCADNVLGATPAKSLDYCVFVRIARLRVLL